MLEPKFRVGPDAACTFCRKSILFQNEDYQTQNDTGKQPIEQPIKCNCKRAQYCSKLCLARDLRFHQSQCTAQVETIAEWQISHLDLQTLQSNRINRSGVSGLQNLTNSCYMNCVLQCLSHCKALTNYFLRGLFIEEINLQNPLGTHGKIATSYARVLRQLWESDLPLIVPSSFKQTISRFKKQFSNLQQQDSQEFLNILLDSLHEDLNRVKEKPLVTMIEYHGDNDVQASQESWEDHLKRCQSIIVDLMHGQFKSTVKCPEADCNHISVTFEPFMNISLPIPEIQLVSKAFVWVPYDINKHCSVHRFTIKGHESIKNLRIFLTHEILTKLGLCHDHNSFEICEVRKDKVTRIMSDQNQVFQLLDHESHLIIYEQPTVKKQKQNCKTAVDSSNILENVSNKRDSINNQSIECDNKTKIQEEIFTRNETNHLPVIMNFQFISYTLDRKEHQSPETVFPRIQQINLDCNLIELHLEIFQHIKYIFTRFLQLKEYQIKSSDLLNQRKQTLDSVFCKNNDVSHFERKIFNRKLQMQTPFSLTLEKWNSMSLSQQYEMVFSSQNYGCRPQQQQSQEKQGSQLFHHNTINQCIDPSRRKPHELPYFVRIVSRKQVHEYQRVKKIVKKKNPKNEFSNYGHSGQTNQRQLIDDESDLFNDSNQVSYMKKCLYCDRKNCEDCPMPFDDKIKLRNFLHDHNITTTESPFIKNDEHEIQNSQNQNQSSQKNRNTGRARNNKNQKGTEPNNEQDQKKNNLNSQNKNVKCTGKLGKKGLSQSDKQIEATQDEDLNSDFQIVIQFNRDTCWGLFELLNRAQNEKQTLLQQLSIQKIHKFRPQTQSYSIENDNHKEVGDNQDEVKNRLFGQNNMQLYADKITINDCFRLFNRPEKLSWENEWYCSKCKAHKQAVKKIEVFKTPPILIITLKRFKGHLSNQKQNTPVHYPIEGLNMRDFMLNNQRTQHSFKIDGFYQNGQEAEIKEVDYVDLSNCHLYDLFAVILHSGALNGGHYTSIAKNKDTWFEFNDKFVVQLQKNEERKIINSNAYILFYQKRNIDFDNIENYEMIKNKLISRIQMQQSLKKPGQDDKHENGQDELFTEQQNIIEDNQRQKRDLFMPNQVRFPLKKIDIQTSHQNNKHNDLLDLMETPFDMKMKGDKNIPTVNQHGKVDLAQNNYIAPIDNLNMPAHLFHSDQDMTTYNVCQKKQQQLNEKGNHISSSYSYQRNKLSKSVSENDMNLQEVKSTIIESKQKQLSCEYYLQNQEHGIDNGMDDDPSHSFEQMDQKSLQKNMCKELFTNTSLKSLNEQPEQVVEKYLLNRQKQQSNHNMTNSGNKIEDNNYQIENKINNTQNLKALQSKLDQDNMFSDRQINTKQHIYRYLSQSESSCISLDSSSSQSESNIDSQSIQTENNSLKQKSSYSHQKDAMSKLIRKLTPSQQIFKLEKVRSRISQSNQVSANPEELPQVMSQIRPAVKKRRQKQDLKQKKLMIQIDIDETIDIRNTKLQQVKLRKKQIIPRKRQKVQLDIKAPQEEADIYSLLEGLDINQNERISSDQFSPKIESDLLALVDKIGSGDLNLDDIQCAKIVLLQNRNNLIKRDNICSLDSMMGV